MEFKNAIKLNSNNAQIYHEYAKFCERHRQPPDYKKATDLYFKACATDPINFLSAAVDAANLMRRLDTKQSRESAKQLFEKLVIEAPHLDGAFLGYAKLLVREKQYKKVSEILNIGLNHHPNDEALKKYYQEYKTISTSRPSILYSVQQTSSSQSQTNHGHAQTTQIMPNSNNNDQQQQQSEQHHGISQSNGAIDKMPSSQKLNKNIELTTNQFVKHISFEPNDQSQSHQSVTQNTTTTTTNPHNQSPQIQASRYSVTPSRTATTANKNQSYSNMSAISLISMSEDNAYPPLPHNKHNSSSSMNTVKKKDSVFTTNGRISHLIHQNSGNYYIIR